MSLVSELKTIADYNPTAYVNNSEPDLDAEHLNKTEQALKRVTDAANDAINALKELEEQKLSLNAIVQTESTATDKVPSSAYLKQALGTINSNLANGYPTKITIKDGLKNSLLKIQGFEDGNAGISLNKDDGTIYRIFLSADGRLRFGKYNNNWSISDVLTNANIQRGRTTVIELPPGEITSKHYTFPKQFSSTPNVVATLFSNSTSIKYGLLTMTVHNITATGFDLRFYNNADIKFAPAVDWIAVS